MPNRNVHVPVGSISGGLVTALAAPMTWRGPYWVEVISALAGGALGGLLPDKIDPPVSPRHRGKGHSVVNTIIGESGLGVVLIALSTKIKVLYSKVDWYRTNEYTVPREVTFKILLLRIIYGFCIGLGAGWFSHQLLDGFTPDGLRLINSKL